MSITPIPCPWPCLLWQVDLDAAPAPAAVACLSKAESARAHRFVFERDRDRFIAAHAALRQILSAQTGIPAAQLDFVNGDFGKPALDGHAGLHFNLSHSQSLAVIAISHNADAEVGIDIELARPMPDAQALAATCFTAQEIRALKALPPARRDRAFLIGWTRKEACLKALGLGLSVDLQTLHVGLETTECAVQYPVDERRPSLRVVSIPLANDALEAVAALALATALPNMHVASKKPAPLEILP